MLALVSKKTRLFVASVLVVLGLASSAFAYFYIAGNGNQTTGVGFWNFVLKQKEADNPLLDTTGAKCRNGQGGYGTPFYLVGAPDNTPVKRTCSVPVGRGITFPILNSLAGAFPDDPANQKTVAYQRSLAQRVKNAKNKKLVIDGTTVNVNWAAVDSDSFSFTFKDGNIFGIPNNTKLDPAVDSGFYVQLTPFDPGTHTIYWHAELDAQYNDGSPLVQDVTYTIKQSFVP